MEHYMYLCGEDGVKKFMFPNLEDLSVCHCLKLRLTPCPPIATIWEVENSDHVLSSWGDGDHGGESASSSSAAATITQLRIIRCSDIIGLHEIPEWFGNLVDLQELVITRCTELRNLQHLSSLRLLSLNECPSITALPEWPGSCLKKLVITDCRGIKSLPKSILTNLERLYICSCCLEFAQWCKENKKQLAHIEDKIIEDRSSQSSEEDDMEDSSSQCRGFSSCLYEDDA